jgi:hypothetical protein
MQMRKLRLHSVYQMKADREWKEHPYNHAEHGRGLIL